MLERWSGWCLMLIALAATLGRADEAAKKERGDSSASEAAATSVPNRVKLARRFLDVARRSDRMTPAELDASYRRLYRDMLREFGPDAYQPYQVLDRLAGLYKDLRQARKTVTAARAARTQADPADFLEPERAVRRELIEALGKSRLVAWLKQGEIAKHEGFLHLADGRIDEARARFDRAEAIFAENPGPCDYSEMGVLGPLAGIAIAQARWDDAEAIVDRAFRVNHRQDARPVEDFNLDYMDQAEGLAIYHLGYTLATRRAGLPGKAAKFAEWSLNSKVYRREAFARQLVVLNTAVDTRTREARERLLESWERLSALAVRPTPVPFTKEARSRRTDTIVAAFGEDRDRSRAAAAVTAAVAKEPPWVTLQQVRRALPLDAVLIDLVEHLEYDISAPAGQISWAAAHEMAFVIPPEGRGEVRLVDLGREEQVQEAVTAYLRGVAPISGAGLRAGRDGAAEAARVSRDLARIWVDPLMPYIRDARRWVVSPSALSWLVPWSSLVLEDGSLVVERYAVSYLPSGRHVCDRPVPIPGVRPPLIVAAPDYELSMPPAKRGRGPFPPLPETADEARAIAPYLEQYAQAAPRVVLGSEARESVLRGRTPPRVLVVSTHGYCGPLPDVKLAAGGPMLECGLALAGANVRRGEPEDDGIATGLEILATDFRGTDLVVLSACQTSYGKFQTSQGLVGLNLAFHLAGARTVLGALWPVPVDETTALTSGFFAELAQGTPKDEALRRSQVKLVRQLRDRSGTAHPTLWAAFLLTGDAIPVRK